MPENTPIIADTTDATLKGKTAFISVADTILYDPEKWEADKAELAEKMAEFDAGTRKRKPYFSPSAANHLILGDWLSFYPETETVGGTLYRKVKCRGDLGWIEEEHHSPKRALEVNFVDIGQGDGCHIVTPEDKHMVIDAGKADHMDRFLSWRYNLRYRNVERAEDFDPSRTVPNKPNTPLVQDPWTIDYIVMSHPDLDHYGGFADLFQNKKLRFEKVYHNGIVERPDKSTHGIGGYFKSSGEQYLKDVITDNAKAQALIDKHPDPSTRLMQALWELRANSPYAEIIGLGVKIDALDRPEFLDGFGDDNSLSLQILGPIHETKRHGGQDILTLRKLGGKGETKNGHSVVFKAGFGKLRLLLGGDLNSQSQNFLLQAYSKADMTIEKIEKEIDKISAKPVPLKAKDQERLTYLVDQQIRTINKGKDVFEVDVAKACHHGSAHILDSFIGCIHASATVISSGDQESYSHPRPDALGAYGKFGFGDRPLIFSTELARSTREFTPRFSQYLALRGITLQIEAETDAKKKKALEKSLESKRDRNVAVYGMITLRALGDIVIIAQKLEVQRSAGSKWDIYALHYDDTIGRFVYDTH